MYYNITNLLIIYTCNNTVCDFRVIDITQIHAFINLHRSEDFNLFDILTVAKTFIKINFLMYYEFFKLIS